MATIKVKKSRKPDFLRGNSANRRHARRKVEAIAIKDIEMQLNSIFQLETKKLNRVEKTLSLSHIPVTRSIEPKYQSSPDNCCLPNIVMFSSVRTKKSKDKFCVTAK